MLCDVNQKPKSRRLLYWLLILFGLLIPLRSAPLAAQSAVIHIGETVEARLRGSRPESWQFTGCEGDRLQFEMTAADFTPTFTVEDGLSDEPLLTAEQAAEDRAVGALTLPATGSYTVTVSSAAGERRGDYTLALHTGAAAPVLEPVGHLAYGDGDPHHGWRPCHAVAGERIGLAA
jgi:hypothetical protein